MSNEIQKKSSDKSLKNTKIIFSILGFLGIALSIYVIMNRFGVAIIGACVGGTVAMIMVTQQISDEQNKRAKEARLTKEQTENIDSIEEEIE